MSYLSDTLTIGVLLVLLFGSVSLYLYTRIQQAEQKIHLLESILLDLKMSAEIKSYTELPADDLNEKANTSFQSFTTEKTAYDAFEDADESSPVEYTSLDETAELVQEQGEQVDPLSFRQSMDHTVITLVEDAMEDDTSQASQASQASHASQVSHTSQAQQAPQALQALQASYESMTLKELQTLARSRGITGAGSMKKGPIMEALKTSDRITTVKPGSTGTGVNSFLETSALVSDESS